MFRKQLTINQANDKLEYLIFDILPIEGLSKIIHAKLSGIYALVSNKLVRN